LSGIAPKLASPFYRTEALGEGECTNPATCRSWTTLYRSRTKGSTVQAEAVRQRHSEVLAEESLFFISLDSQDFSLRSK